MLTVEIPGTYELERRYILSVLLGDLLGVPYQVTLSDRSGFRLSMDQCDLVIADDFFDMPQERWLSPESVPETLLATWPLAEIPMEFKACDTYLPVLFGRPTIGFAENRIDLGLDIFGSAFFMLSRYEEVSRPERDARERFPSEASLAYRADFLDRPIVNEYLELLWACMMRLWPRLNRKSRRYQLTLSHDVDWPLARYEGLLRNLKTTAGDLLKRRSLKLAGRRLGGFITPRWDPYNTFDFLMDVSDSHGINSAFYFITDHSAGQIDGTYSLEDPWIRNLLKRIASRGHEVGLHPSYDTYDDPARIKHEFARLRSACESLGITQEKWGGRQHFLRWKADATWRHWEKAGLAYDSSLSFADHVGFRAGICDTYTAYSLKERRALRLQERPLIVMDVSVAAYMGKSPEAIEMRIQDLSQRCRLFEGNFTLLWHNSSLATDQARSHYAELVTLARP